MIRKKIDVALVIVAIVLFITAINARDKIEVSRVRGEHYWQNSWHRNEMIALASEFESRAYSSEIGRIDRCKLIIKKRNQLLAQIEDNLKNSSIKARIITPKWLYYYEGKNLAWVETPDPVIYIYER